MPALIETDVHFMLLLCYDTITVLYTGLGTKSNFSGGGCTLSVQNLIFPAATTRRFWLRYVGTEGTVKARHGV